MGLYRGIVKQRLMFWEIARKPMETAPIAGREPNGGFGVVHAIGRYWDRNPIKMERLLCFATLSLLH